jgi:Pyridoxamine 5'-phosphate oxidase
VNVSPKGYADTFAILGPTSVAYLDLTGSGAETIAHLRQNGRITVMFCSFERQPKILRLYGTGAVVLPGTDEFESLLTHFPVASLGSNPASQRAIIRVELDRISDSCGYAVPRMELVEERDVLVRSDQRKSAEQLAAYRAEKNSVSIDGLPALDRLAAR